MFSFCDVWQKTELKMTFLWKEIEFLLWLRAPNPQWREANWKLTYRMWGMVDIILMRPFVWAWQGQNHCWTEFSIHQRLQSCVELQKLNMFGHMCRRMLRNDHESHKYKNARLRNALKKMRTKKYLKEKSRPHFSKSTLREYKKAVTLFHEYIQYCL